MKNLVQKSAISLDINIVSCPFSGLVPLHNACSYGHFEVTELLLKVRFAKSFYSELDDLALSELLSTT